MLKFDDDFLVVETQIEIEIVAGMAHLNLILQGGVLVETWNIDQSNDRIHYKVCKRNYQVVKMYAIVIEMK